jgi:hypothetical protein
VARACPGFETVEIQTSDGDLDELDEEVWQSLPLALAEPPQDWTGSIDAEDQEELETEPASGGRRPPALFRSLADCSRAYGMLRSVEHIIASR